MTWVKTDFQKLQREIKETQEKLDTLMRQPFSQTIYEEQKSLHVAYSILLPQEEKYWRQRSRVQWLKEGDRNSAFFHRKASNRKAKNTIKGLNDEQGNWRNEPPEIKRLLLKYLQHISTAEQVDRNAIDVVMEAIPCRVTKEMNDDFQRQYTNEEIKKALIQIHPSKSPGLDDMSLFFFTKNIGMWCVKMCVGQFETG